MEDTHREAIDEYNRLRQAICGILARHDPMGIGPGKITPEDEYSMEADRITGVVLPRSSRARKDVVYFAVEINKIWGECFSEDCRGAEEIAREILQLL